jgi:hypothetical protein
MPQFGREGPTHEHALDSLDRPVYGGGMLDIDPGRGAVANAAAPGLGTGIGVLVSSFAVQWLPAATRLVYLVGRLRTRRRKLGIQRSIATSGYDRRVSGVEFLAGPLVIGGVLVVQALGLSLLPETSPRALGAWRSLIPQIEVPAQTRRPMTEPPRQASASVPASRAASVWPLPWPTPISEPGCSLRFHRLLRRVGHSCRPGRCGRRPWWGAHHYQLRISAWP